jgi:hypothetical protein
LIVNHLQEEDIKKGKLIKLIKFIKNENHLQVKQNQVLEQNTKGYNFIKDYIF